MSISVSRGGSLAAASDRVILSVEDKLFEADSSGSDSPKPSATLHGGESFGFSLPFPTYITNGRDPLPPSQSLSQQGTYCTVNYTVRVDIIRKGLRRHERCAFLSGVSMRPEGLELIAARVDQLSGSRYQSCTYPVLPHPAKSNWA